MIAGLRQAGVEVIECHAQLWQGVEDRVRAVGGGWRSPAFWVRVLRAYGRLLRRYREIKDYDLLVVGYPGQFDVYLARLLSRLKGKPLVWDIFMSIYLIAAERGLDRSSALAVRALRALERRACRLPDRLILDTSEYVQWFQETHGVSPDRFRLVPTGADDRTFRPTRAPARGPGWRDGTFRALYYGSFIPNHSVETIVEAAHLLAGETGIHFELIGAGPDEPKARALAEKYGLKNLTFAGWMDKDELVKRIAAADICLGAFGSSPQSLMTVQNKIYEGLAMAKPVITGDSAAIRQAFQPGLHLWVCERENPAALAEAIRRLHAEPALRTTMGEAGYRLFCEAYSLARIGETFRQHLAEAG
jgi:glycosyltransferase involved in cell wall biosynthesis